VRLFVSQSIVDEVSGVLLEKFGWTSPEVRQFLPRLWSRCFLVEPSSRVHVCADPDDDRILECAVAADASYIVTGDDHLLRLKTFRGIQIVRPAAFLRILG
jgi:uncharacterized protein